MRGVFRGPEKTTLSLLKNVPFSLGGVGAKANLDNFTKYDLFLRRPLADKANNNYRAEFSLFCAPQVYCPIKYLSKLGSSEKQTLSDPTCYSHHSHQI